MSGNAYGNLLITPGNMFYYICSIICSNTRNTKNPKLTNLIESKCLFLHCDCVEH